MSGLKFDNAVPAVIPAKTHSIIDYIHAGTNIVAGILFQKRGNNRAAYGAYALGAAVLGNALMTDYDLGVFRLYSFKVHGILDYSVAAASAALPSMLSIQGTPEATYFHAQGAGEAVIAGMSDYNDESGSERYQQLTERRFRPRRAA
jgi:hypothetical protein